MRAFRTVVLIIGLLSPLVIQAQPFGDTELNVFDVDFLPAPSEPLPGPPEEPPLPLWVAWAPDPESAPPSLPPILLPELPS